jgi:hypothetical protein
MCLTYVPQFSQGGDENISLLYEVIAILFSLTKKMSYVFLVLYLCDISAENKK